MDRMTWGSSTQPPGTTKNIMGIQGYVPNACHRPQKNYTVFGLFKGLLLTSIIPYSRGKGCNLGFFHSGFDGSKAGKLRWKKMEGRNLVQTPWNGTICYSQFLKAVFWCIEYHGVLDHSPNRKLDWIWPVLHLYHTFSMKMHGCTKFPRSFWYRWFRWFVHE